MKPKHKATLLEIADAWERVAEERERQGGKEEPGEKEIEASREWNTSVGKTRPATEAAKPQPNGKERLGSR
jgi:hypothetical protein